MENIRKSINNNSWVDDGDGDDDSGDDDGCDDDGGYDCDEMGKIRKTKFPKIVKKSLKIKRLRYNREESEIQHFL